MKNETETLVNTLKWKAKTIAKNNRGYSMKHTMEYKAAAMIEKLVKQNEKLKDKHLAALIKCEQK